MNTTTAVLAGLLAALSGAACNVKTPAPTTATTRPTTPTQAQAAPAAAAKPSALESPYKKTVFIFQEFTQLIEQHQNTPDKGFETCARFAETKIPEIKALTMQIKTIETSTQASQYLPEIMDSNDRIKAATEKATRLAQEKYGTKGADVMLLLADMALARL